MNAAPWPLSAGAFNASVRAGLLSSKTLAKADFFTGNLCLKYFEGRLCVCVCVCVFRGLDLNKLLHIFFSNAAYRYIRSWASGVAVCAGRRSASKHDSLYSNHVQTRARTQLPPTSQVTEGQDAKTSCVVPSAASTPSANAEMCSDHYRIQSLAQTWASNAVKSRQTQQNKNSHKLYFRILIIYCSLHTI